MLPSYQPGGGRVEVVADHYNPDHCGETTYFWPREYPQSLQNSSCLMLSYTRPISHYRGQERHQGRKDHHVMNSTEQSRSNQ